MTYGSYNLFLDDLRQPIDAFKYTEDYVYLNIRWVVVRDFAEFAELIIDRGLPELISFDHDLSDVHYKHLSNPIPYDAMTEKTGYHCAQWLADYCLDNKVPLPEFRCHSMNPAGKENILSLLNSFKAHQDRTTETMDEVMM